MIDNKLLPGIHEFALAKHVTVERIELRPDPSARLGESLRQDDETVDEQLEQTSVLLRWLG